MRTSNGDKNIRSNNLGWYLLADYALGEMTPDNGNQFELTAGFLFQLLQELGVPPELIRKIESTLTGFTQKTRMPVKPSRMERPGSLRVFCQKRVIDGANAAKTSRPDHTEPTIETVLIKYPYGTILNGGWGYFIIDRSGGDAGSSERSSPLVDLYLYQEGE